jgi:hypothetical protein
MPVVLAFLWHQLDVGCENILALLNQSPQVIAIAPDHDIYVTGLRIFRPVDKLDAIPIWPYAGVLQPNPESGG